MPELSDEKYMEQLQGGQFDAMTVLFSRYQAAIYRYFFKQSFDSSLSQELTQQVFVRAFEKRISFSGREGMFADHGFTGSHIICGLIIYVLQHQKTKRRLN